MTLKYEITKLYRRKEIISVCMISHKDFKEGKRETIDIRVDNVWHEIKPVIPNYKHYSHGIHPKELKKKYPDVYERLEAIRN